MTTVYVVTSGEYSAYRIERVFLDRELAERFAALECGSYDGRTVESFEVDEGQDIAELEARRVVQLVTVITDGVAGETITSGRVAEDAPPVTSNVTVRLSRRFLNGVVQPSLRPDGLRCEITARTEGHDPERVAKAHAELVARTLAEHDVLAEAQKQADLARFEDRRNQREAAASLFLPGTPAHSQALREPLADPWDARYASTASFVPGAFVVGGCTLDDLADGAE